MEEASATPLLPMHCPECGKTVDVSGLPPYSKIECPHCAALIRVRSTMGQYEIVGVLGEGGMSQVFRAVDRTLGREVALKILHQSLSRDAALTAMFEREAKLTASIVHPNVVKVFSVGQDQGYFYIAMELLRATSLELLIANKGALSESEVLGIALEVARGLKAAYEEKLIHRDIKPGNMLVTGEGTTKLVDFGLALQQGGEDISEDLWATPFYVPPEKLDGASDTFLGDIYSLGATIYHALAGKPPFDANTPSLEELKEIKRQPVDLKAVAPGLSKPTVKLVERMMAYRPEDRVQSYDELIEAVEEVRRRQFGIVASGRARTKPGRVRLLAAVGGGVAALVLVILILAGRDDPGDPGDLGIGNGERVITVGDSTVSGQFQGARELLAEGKRRDAGAGFESLAANESAPASTRIWSHFLLGTIRLFEGETSLAEESFEAVGKLPPESDAASAASIEFLQRAAGPLAEPLPVLGEDAAFASDSVEVLGLLAAGLKNWQAGAFESGAELLRAFAESSPPEAYPWIEPIKRQVRPFLADLELIRGLPNPGDPGAADDQGGLAEQGEALKEVAAKLRTRGAAPGLVARRLERLAEIGKLAAAAKPAGTAAPQATATPPPVTPTTGTPTTGTPTTGTPTTGTPTTGTPTTGTPGTPVPSPTEAAEIAQLKALVEENRPLAESLLFSGIAIKLKEVAPETLLGASVREALALACADAPRFPAELARALAVRPWRGSVRRRAGRPLDATVSAKDEETFVVDLGFGPNEVELGEFALDWLVEAGLDSLAPVGEGGIGPWRSLLAFAALSGQVGMLEGKAAELAEADGEFARSWAALKHLR
jgi:cell division septation protein DedD